MVVSLNPVPDVEKNLLFDNGAIGNPDNTDFELPEWIPDERREAVQLLTSSLPDVCKLNRDSCNEAFIFEKSKFLKNFKYY